MIVNKSGKLILATLVLVVSILIGLGFYLFTQVQNFQLNNTANNSDGSVSVNNTDTIPDEEQILKVSLNQVATSGTPITEFVIRGVVQESFQVGESGYRTRIIIEGDDSVTPVTLILPIGGTIKFGESKIVATGTEITYFDRSIHDVVDIVDMGKLIEIQGGYSVESPYHEALNKIITSKAIDPNLLLVPNRLAVL